MTWTTVIGLLRAVPARAWRFIGGAAVLAAIVGSLHLAAEKIRTDAREAVFDEAYRVNQPALRWQREAYGRQLDSTRKAAARYRDSVRSHVRAVYRWAPLIPDSLRSRYTEVDSLAWACTRLARDCDSLRIASARIDTLVDTLRVVDSTALRAMSLTLVQKDGRIAALEAKSCTVPAAISGGVGAVLGMAFGRSRR